MPLTTAKGPAGGTRAVQNALGRILPQPAGFMARAAAAGAEDMALSVPHPVYDVGLDDIERGRLTSAAKLTGWRYLLVGGEEAVAAAEVASADGTAVRFSHFNEGPFVGSTVEGLTAAERLPEVKSGNYEVRLLRAPALYLIALWLHGTREDLFLPLPPAPTGVEALRKYGEKDLLAALRGPARSRGRFDDRPEAAPR
jgi:hypothetical protein